MNASPLATAELVVHVFAPAEGPRAAGCYQELRLLWDRIRASLGLVQEVPALRVPAVLPLTVDAVGQGGVAACAGDHPDGLYQALFRKSHDVLILSAALAPRVAAAGTWLELQRRWDGLALLPGAVYGAATIFQGLLRADHVSRRELTPLARSLAPLVPGARTEPSWHDRGCVAGDGLAVWETGPADDGRPERQLLAVASPGKDEALSAWTWSAGGVTTTPLTRYLMHAAKLRYEYRVWQGDMPGVHRRRDQVSADTAVVLGQLRSADHGRSFDAEAVARLLQPCYALESEVAVLVDISSQIRQVRRTVDIAVANLSASVEPSLARARASMFADDQQLGRWLTTQLDDDATYLAAVKEGARDVVAAVRGALERQSDALKQAERERQERISLLQALVISAAVLCLTVVQALGYRVPLNDGVRPAMVAALSAWAVWLVVVVIRLVANPYRAATRPSRRTAWLVAESLVTGLALAATAWVITSWIRLQLLGERPSPGITWASAAAGFAIGAAAVVIRRAGRRAGGT
jgi:hypothetical protein